MVAIMMLVQKWNTLPFSVGALSTLGWSSFIFWVEQFFGVEQFFFGVEQLYILGGAVFWIGAALYFG